MMFRALLVALVVVAAEALPFRFPDEVAQFRARPPPPSVPLGYGLRGGPPDVGPLPGISEEQSRWLQMLRVSPDPTNYVQDREGPSIFDDYYAPVHPHAAASSRTLFFEEFPHERAVLNWQEKRIRQGLPIYKLLSQRPGFPFYQGN